MAERERGQEETPHVDRSERSTVPPESPPVSSGAAPRYDSDPAADIGLRDPLPPPDDAGATIAPSASSRRNVRNTRRVIG